MRYMAKMMRSALRTRFPSAPDKDVLKVFKFIWLRVLNFNILLLVLTLNVLERNVQL
jgi:hypothetical protein